MLDTWDTVYYMLPFVLALLAWESLGEPAPSRRARAVEHRARVGELPVAARHTSRPTPRRAFFLAWTVPLAAGLALRLYAPELAAG